MRAYKQTVDFWAGDFHMRPLTSVNVQEISAAGPVRPGRSTHQALNSLQLCRTTTLRCRPSLSSTRP